MLYYLKKIRGIDMAAVKTVSLTKEYSNGEHYLRAVDDISFTVVESKFPVNSSPKSMVGCV